MRKRFILEWGTLFAVLIIVLPLIYQFFIRGEEDIIRLIFIQIRYVAPTLSVTLAVSQFIRYRKNKT